MQNFRGTIFLLPRCGGSFFFSAKVIIRYNHSPLGIILQLWLFPANPKNGTLFFFSLISVSSTGFALSLIEKQSKGERFKTYYSSTLSTRKWKYGLRFLALLHFVFLFPQRKE